MTYRGLVRATQLASKERPVSSPARPLSAGEGRVRVPVLLAARVSACAIHRVPSPCPLPRGKNVRAREETVQKSSQANKKWNVSSSDFPSSIRLTWKNVTNNELTV